MVDKKKAMGWVIIVLMSLSIVGFLGSGISGGATTSLNKEYNGFTFYTEGYQWRLQLGQTPYFFQNLPAKLEDINIPVNTKGWLNEPKIYLGFEPNETQSISEQVLRLQQVFSNNNVIPQESCLFEEDCPDIPIIDCENNKGIIIKLGNNEGFHEQGNCLVMESSSSRDMQKLTERLIYKLLGVMT
jgi:hypothetical protein